MVYELFAFGKKKKCTGRAWEHAHVGKTLHNSHSRNGEALLFPDMDAAKSNWSLINRTTGWGWVGLLVRLQTIISESSKLLRVIDICYARQ